MIFGLALLLVLAWALVRPWRLALSVQGRVDARSFAVAGGAKLGAIAIAGAWTNAGGTWNLHVFGRRIRVAMPKRARAPRSRGPRVDLLDALVSAFDVAMTLGLESVDLDVHCAFDDPLLDGRAAGAIAVLGATLAPFGDVRGEVDWVGEPHVDLRAEVTLRLVVWRIARVAAAFGARRLHPARAASIASIPHQ